jgi:hypothetical protein
MFTLEGGSRRAGLCQLDTAPAELLRAFAAIQPLDVGLRVLGPSRSFNSRSGVGGELHSSSLGTRRGVFTRRSLTRAVAGPSTVRKKLVRSRTSGRDRVGACRASPETLGRRKRAAGRARETQRRAGCVGNHQLHSRACAAERPRIGALAWSGPPRSAGPASCNVATRPPPTPIGAPAV